MQGPHGLGRLMSLKVKEREANRLRIESGQNPHFAGKVNQ